MEKDKKSTSGLPPWEIRDDGMIQTSGLGNAKVMIYTFVEAALAHNERIIEDSKEEKARAVKVEAKYAVSPALEPDPNPLPLTKESVNQLLTGTYTLGGIRRWWQRPRKTLDMKTPHEMWETEPERVLAEAKKLLGGPPAERKD